jgi:hypothetical protein
LGGTESQGPTSNATIPPADPNVNPSQTFEQGQADSPRAKVDIYRATPENRSAYVIHVMKKADRSTVPHELAHVFLHDMMEYATQEGADAQTRNDLAKLLNWAGGRWRVDPELKKGTPEYKAQAKEVTETIEKIVRGFEQYLAEGKAPSLELTNPFALFSKWLTRVYANIRQYVGQDLNPQVRGVYDRWLASEREIAEAEAYYRGRYGEAFINLIDDEEKRNKLK